MNESRSGPGEDPQNSLAPSADEVAAQMRRILSSTEFAQSDRLRSFLSFVVNETLAGRADALKEYTIALEVFERDESFDPQTSSIVRVEASRLRAKLREYYAIKGRDDPVHVSLPSGSYGPTFHRADDDGEPESKRLNNEPPATGGMVSTRRVAVVLTTVVFLISASAFLFPYFESRVAPPPVTSKPAPVYSIAVLPLHNLSGDPSQEYFSDGMTNALISRLAKYRGVRVISLTSAMAYKNVSGLITDIARELNATHVVEGAVIRSGERVRISAQFIEAATDRHLWAESYDRNVADILEIQDDVAQRIVGSLSGKGATGPAKHLGSTNEMAVGAAAREAYLKGLFFRNKLTAEGFRKGVAFFRQAIEKEPEYAVAHSGIATCYCLLGGHGFELVDPRQGMPTAKSEIMESLRLDDTLAEAHAFLGIIRLKYEWDWPGAEISFKRAIQLNPSYSQGRLFYSFFLESLGRQEEAIREAEEARALDPLSLPANVNLGWQYLRAGRLEQAKLMFSLTAELNPDFWGIHWGMGHYYRRKAEYGAAIQAFQRAVNAGGGGQPLSLSNLGYTYALSGKPDEARRILARLQSLAEKRYVSPFNIATIHAGLGDHSEALSWLEKAYQHRSRSMAWLNVESEYDGLRSNPGFKSLLRRIGNPG